MLKSHIEGIYVTSG